MWLPGGETFPRLVWSCDYILAGKVNKNGVCGFYETLLGVGEARPPPALLPELWNVDEMARMETAIVGQKVT